MAYRILIVEDEAKIARFVELELKHEGYEVEVAHDGRTGYERGISGEFDLMILDLMLPVMSGIEVCRRIRRESEIAIIMLTAKDDVSDKVTGLDIGANDYMTKPFQLLEYMMNNKSIVLTREKILEYVWGYDYMGDTNITDVYIRYLRAKIDDKYDVKYIHTVRGVGYCFKNG